MNRSFAEEMKNTSAEHCHYASSLPLLRGLRGGAAARFNKCSATLNSAQPGRSNTSRNIGLTFPGRAGLRSVAFS